MLSKNVYFHNVLDPKHCSELETAFFDFIKTSDFVNDDSNTNKLIKGLSHPYIRIPKLQHFDHIKHIKELTKKISIHYNESIKFCNSYIRVYYNQSSLPIHTDRNGLDITLSVNIGGLSNWPILISDFRRKASVDSITNCPEELEFHTTNIKSFLTPLGCGVACYGDSPHWRDKLICKEDEYVLQIFYHWSFLN